MNGVVIYITYCAFARSGGEHVDQKNILVVSVRSMLKISIARIMCEFHGRRAGGLAPSLFPGNFTFFYVNYSCQK